MDAICQSCGMPLSRDEKGGGTNVDGSASREYCSHCYQEGTWTLPGLTVDQMQQRVGGLLKTRGLPDSFVEKAVAGIPALKRWK